MIGPTHIVNVPHREYYGEQFAGGTNANLTVQRRPRNWRLGFNQLRIESPTSTEDVRIALTPAIIGVYFNDTSAGTWKDLLGSTKAIIDSAQTGDAQFTMASADYLYIATTDRHGGFRFDLTAVNNNAATATFEYSKADGFNAFAATVTDGTISSSATLGQDGNLTAATTPSEASWSRINLREVLDDSAAPVQVAHWSRLTPSADLDSVSIAQLMCLHYDMAHTAASGHAGFFKDQVEYTITKSGFIGGFEQQSSDSGAITMNLTWIRD